MVPVEAELRRRGHDVIAVDPPADDDSAGLKAYADTVVDAIGDRRYLILVARSMAGIIAPLVCERVDVDLLVMLNAMVPEPGETGAEWWEATGHAQARREQAIRQGRDLAGDDDLVETFFHDVPPGVTAEAMRHDRNQSGTPFLETWPLATWPNVPTRYLVCRDDPFSPVAFMRQVVRERAGVLPDEMDGGHLVALGRPKELVDRLGAYCFELATSDGRA